MIIVEINICVMSQVISRSSGLPESVCGHTGAQQLAVSVGVASSVSVELVITDTRWNTSQHVSLGLEGL